MAKTAMQRVLGVAKVEASVLTDAELLRRFAEGDQAAFTTLVRRHTNLVLGVCRRSLPAAADAEDACQAVFVVLARKAKGTRWQSSVANWLYTTARKVSKDARVAVERRVKREGKAGVPEVTPPVDQMTARELFDALDDELDRLPPTYREPLVLCYLEGLSREDAAVRLGVPAATVKTRLERGRKKLGEALTRRGVAIGLGLLALAATSPAGASPPRLVESVLAAVGGTPPESVAALARGVAMTGTLTRMKLALMAVVGVTTVGLGLATMALAADPPKMDKPKAEQKTEAKKPADTPKERGVTGTVTGPDGKPMQAEVILIRPDGKPESLGKAGADGAFKLTVPPIEYGYLVATANGYGVAFAFVSRDTPGEVAFKLTKDNAIRGRVIDTQGKPVAGATVFPYRVDDYGSKGVEIFLKHWMTRNPQHPLLSGETEMLLRQNTGFDLPDGRTVLATKTDADGKFQLHGVGAERVVMLGARGPGIADTEVMVVNRADFDPTEADKAAADNRERMLPQSLRSRLTPPHLHGPTVTLVAEQEKIVRGVVTDLDTGKPRAGVTVSFSRMNGTSLQWHNHSAITDKDGKYEIHGGRKQSAYTPEVLADAESGYLPAQGEAKDTAGYEPIIIDISTAKGIILTGTLKNKETGKPLPGSVYAEPMQENPFLKKFPTMSRSRSGPTYAAVREDGTYRLVIPPGPVLLMAGTHNDVMFKLPQADPKYPQYFHGEWGTVAYVTANGGYTTIRGCWCKVVDVVEGEKTATQDVEFEPTTRKEVKVMDVDGKPVKSCNVAGMKPQRSYPLYQDSSTVHVYGLEPKKERLVVVCEQRTKLIGSAVVKESDKEPVVTLRSGGTVTGRAMDADGKPLAGVVVQLHHLTPEADDIFGLLHEAEQVTTDADGKFHIEHTVPGFEFRLAFSKGSKNLGPKAAKAPKYAGPKSGESADLGDVKVDSIGT